MSATQSAPPRVSERVRALHAEVLSARPALCTERALLITRFFRRRETGRDRPLVVQKAEALAHVLRHKSVRIYPRELLVGCFTSQRVGGGLFPELHGVAVLEDVFRFQARRVNPLEVTAEERRQLLIEVLPYWLPRALPLRSLPLGRALRFVREQLAPLSYLINESGGISHFVPSYGELVTLGTEGYRRRIEERQRALRPNGEGAPLLEAMTIACDGLDDFANGYRLQAERLARNEPDRVRRAELAQIAEVCARVPRRPARSLQEALQSILFAQIALNLESLDNSVSPGRLDQILMPLYRRDRDRGALDAERALELLGCFAVKLCELVPVFSRRITRFHGGMFNGQVVVIGGLDRDGRDATNGLSYLFLELLDQLRTRQPNYHARLHRESPIEFRARTALALASGASSPAVYNDDRIVPLLESRAIALADCRDYANVGCVEPVAAGKSFLSTDAALFNLPLCLELALNRGRRFGSRRRIGPRTAAVETCRSIEQLVELFRIQVVSAVERMIGDLKAIERGNARFHPTPLSSMLLDGCIESARDASSGGARYNGSGIQGVGVVEVGDSLSAIEAIVFDKKAATLSEVVSACRNGFEGAAALRARLLGAPKYGNDDVRADRWVARAMQVFSSALQGRTTTRGGIYAAGFYSVTAHVAFGQIVGALPSGRRAGDPFSSGLSPASGADRAGPTAALVSYAALPLALAMNGVNYNLELAPWSVCDEPETGRLRALIDGAFDAGCMQLQVNVLDPKILLEARDHPGRHPGLLVRVSGYSAYFDDLSPEVKQEIIDRFVQSTTAPTA